MIDNASYVRTFHAVVRAAMRPPPAGGVLELFLEPGMLACTHGCAKGGTSDSDGSKMQQETKNWQLAGMLRV